MHLLVALVVTVGVIVLVTPFVAGAYVSRHRDDVQPVVGAQFDTILMEPPSSMVGYVASDTVVFFMDDPLTSHSLPRTDELVPAYIADTVLSSRIAVGALPPADVFPVDATWRPWGYELPPAEQHYPIQLELEMTPTRSLRGNTVEQKQGERQGHIVKDDFHVHVIEYV